MNEGLCGFEQIAERRIHAAIEAGELSDLPGQGKPLDLDADAFVPEHLRVAYCILKNAGVTPPELELRRYRLGLQRLIRTLGEGEARAAAVSKLALLEARVEGAGRSLPRGPYRDRLLARLGLARWLLRPQLRRPQGVRDARSPDGPIEPVIALERPDRRPGRSIRQATGSGLRSVKRRKPRSTR